MHTSWHTSDISFAVRSLTSLCRTMGNPPIGHERACMHHRETGATGTRGGGKCWLPAISESNGISEGTFVEGGSNSSSGRVVSQLEAPLS